MYGRWQLKLCSYGRITWIKLPEPASAFYSVVKCLNVIHVSNMGPTCSYIYKLLTNFYVQGVVCAKNDFVCHLHCLQFQGKN